MTEKQKNDGAVTLEAIIGPQFRSLGWPAFKSDFPASAALFPAARPTKQVFAQR